MTGVSPGPRVTGRYSPAQHDSEHDTWSNMLKRLLRLHLPDGRGMGGDVTTQHPGSGNRSWGGCTARVVYNEGRDAHHCKGHKADQEGYQHVCPCGFRWAG